MREHAQIHIGITVMSFPSYFIFHKLKMFYILYGHYYIILPLAYTVLLHTKYHFHLHNDLKTFWINNEHINIISYIWLEITIAVARIYTSLAVVTSSSVLTFAYEKDLKGREHRYHSSLNWSSGLWGIFSKGSSNTGCHKSTYNLITWLTIFGRSCLL